MEKKSPLKLIQEFHLSHDETNSKLEKLVKAEMEKSSGLVSKQLHHSNIGGWHSDRELHARLGDGSPMSNALLQLFASFSDPINEYINSCHEKMNVSPSKSYLWDYTGAWFNVSVKGGYNAPHVHPGNQISAAYYVRTEEPTAEYPYSGRIDFIHNNMQYPFYPKPGTLILFPSDMLHWVHPYYGSGIRICLSFNAAHIQPE